MENVKFVLTLHDFYFFLILIASIWGVVKVYRELKQPSDNIKQLVESHDEWLRRDLQRIRRVEDCQDLLLECLYSIVEHELTGNGLETFKEVQNDIHDYLVKRGRNVND